MRKEFLFIYYGKELESFSNLLLVPPAVATETGHHEVVTLLRQELGPVPAIQHKQNKGTVTGCDDIIYGIS
jgi:hypothetical protein